jgi:hypothetical protein
MLVKGSLQDGRQIHLQFYARDDLTQSEHGGEQMPRSWFDLSLSEEEARAFAGWLKGNRATEHRGTTIRARGAADYLMIEDASSRFAVRLGTAEQIASLLKELSGTLGLRIGEPVDPATLP